MKKTSLLFLLAFAAVMTAFADGLPKMVFKSYDGFIGEISSENLKIVFQDGKVIASNTSESLSLPLTTLSKFQFSSPSTTSIDKTEATDESAVEAFTPTGIYMGCFTSEDEARQKLPKGIYVMKSNNLTRKILVR